MTNELRIPASEQIHLSEIRPADRTAFFEHLNDKDKIARAIHTALFKPAYPTAERWMMADTARLFEDDDE